MKTKQTNIGKGVRGSRGFSLVELMIVMAILGILGVFVGVAINSADAKLRSFVFNLASRFKQAKYEAMKRGRDVYIDFDLNNDGVLNNGYTMWVDNNGDRGYDAWDAATNDRVHGTVPKNGVCDDDEGADCKIGNEDVVFPNQANVSVGHPGPEIYSTATAAGGPTVGYKGGSIGDGVAGSFGTNFFRFAPSGDCSAGTVYIYFPVSRAGGKVVAAGPWAITVSSVGRIRVNEWKPASGGAVDANGWPDN